MGRRTPGAGGPGRAGHGGDGKGAMELFAQAQPEGAALALALAFDEVLGQQLLDVLVGAGAAQLHQVRLQDPFFQGDRGQGAQGGGGEVHRQQALDQIAQALAQLQAVALALLADFQGRVPVGVVGHQGDQGQFGLIPGDHRDLRQGPQGEGLALQIKNGLQPGRQG